VGASLAAEIAAIWPQAVRHLALIAPFGLFDEKEPATDPWAQRAPDLPSLLCADPARWEALKAGPEGHNDLEWPIGQTRARLSCVLVSAPCLRLLAPEHHSQHLRHFPTRSGFAA